MTSRAYGARSPRSRYDVILIVTSFATELATPTVTDVRTYVRTDTLLRLIYKDCAVRSCSVLHCPIRRCLLRSCNFSDSDDQCFSEADNAFTITEAFGDDYTMSRKIQSSFAVRATLMNACFPDVEALAVHYRQEVRLCCLPFVCCFRVAIEASRVNLPFIYIHLLFSVGQRIT